MSRLVIETRLAAEEDLVDHFAWLLQEAGEDVAEAMLANAAATFARLADTPGLGSPVDMRRPDLGKMRKWRVSGFSKLLIFYLATEHRLFVIRVLHSARDWLSELENG